MLRYSSHPCPHAGFMKVYVSNVQLYFFPSRILTCHHYQIAGMKHWTVSKSSWSFDASVQIRSSWAYRNSSARNSDHSLPNRRRSIWVRFMPKVIAAPLSYSFCLPERIRRISCWSLLRTRWGHWACACIFTLFSYIYRHFFLTWSSILVRHEVLWGFWKHWNHQHFLFCIEVLSSCTVPHCTYIYEIVMHIIMLIPMKGHVQMGCGSFRNVMRHTLFTI